MSNLTQEQLDRIDGFLKAKREECRIPMGASPGSVGIDVHPEGMFIREIAWQAAMAAAPELIDASDETPVAFRRDIADWFVVGALHGRAARRGQLAP